MLKREVNFLINKARRNISATNLVTLCWKILRELDIWSFKFPCSNDNSVNISISSQLNPLIGSPGCSTGKRKMRKIPFCAGYFMYVDTISFKVIFRITCLWYIYLKIIILKYVYFKKLLTMCSWSYSTGVKTCQVVNGHCSMRNFDEIMFQFFPWVFDFVV